jgi:hypothetical protein
MSSPLNGRQRAKLPGLPNAPQRRDGASIQEPGLQKRLARQRYMLRDACWRQFTFAPTLLR